ncbi:MAG: folate-binding protein YgfZ [Deltaproteobacteria bacterium]|nr:folate-binding protein YgfZ [Deltaproteobacteria bacterium]MBI3016467.1 folate-binding protein YgfZ [Deltaproteobacteria bacterium]
MKLALLDLSERCLIEVGGSDSRLFLNGILTQDIKTLAAGTGCYACLCTPKGKILADLFCYAAEDHFKIECHQNLKDKILELLSRYILIQKVSLQDLSQEWGGVGVLGRESPSFIQKHFPKSSGIIYKLQWGYPCFEFWMKKERLLSFQKQLALPLISKEEQEILRIESKTPLYGVDMNENTIPQEANLSDALNFKKGCYIGQETIARLQNLGHVNKQLRLFQVSNSDILSKGTIIHTLAGEETGEITSSCYSPKYQCVIALGYIRYAHFEEKEFRVGEKLAKIL